MFKKQTELPPEPKLITGKQICEDIAVSDQDSLYSNIARKIISVNDVPDSNSKGESFNPKSFQVIDQVLKVEDDMTTTRKLLMKELENFNVLTSDMEKLQELITNVGHS